MTKEEFLRKWCVTGMALDSLIKRDLDAVIKPYEIIMRMAGVPEHFIEAPNIIPDITEEDRVWAKEEVKRLGL